MSGLRSLVVLSLLGLLSACATPFQSEVARFHAIQSIAPGSTFAVEAADPEKRESLEFRTYANRLSATLEAKGLRAAPSGASADYLVMMDYGVDQGRERIESRPGYGGGPWGYGAGYGYYPWRYTGYYGWYDPFWSTWGPGSFGYPEVYSYTEYGSFLDVQIKARGGPVVYESRANAETRTRDLTKLVPLLVQATFADFPGQSGQTVRVSIDDKGRATTKATRG